MEEGQKEGASNFQGSNWFFSRKEIARCVLSERGRDVNFSNDGEWKSCDETSASACRLLLDSQARSILGTSVDELFNRNLIRIHFSLCVYSALLSKCEHRNKFYGQNNFLIWNLSTTIALALWITLLLLNLNVIFHLKLSHALPSCINLLAHAPLARTHHILWWHWGPSPKDHSKTEASFAPKSRNTRNTIGYRVCKGLTGVHAGN